VKVLLDTHALLWFALGDPKLSKMALSHIVDPATTKLVSPASFWEIAIKISIGKYALREPYLDFMQRAIFANGFQLLPIEPEHTAELISMPFHHKDPFDRLLAAQSLSESVPLVSSDPSLDRYGVVRIW
jgi:PIN domain nuclease of toxin-antitoxin system